MQAAATNAIVLRSGRRSGAVTVTHASAKTSPMPSIRVRITAPATARAIAASMTPVRPSSDRVRRIIAPLQNSHTRPDSMPFSEVLRR